MFGVSLPELLLIFFIILIIFGPEKLPSVARTLGKLTGQLKRQSDSLRREFYKSVYEPSSKIRDELESTQRELTTLKEKYFEHKPQDPLCPDTIAEKEGPAKEAEVKAEEDKQESQDNEGDKK